MSDKSTWPAISVPMPMIKCSHGWGQGSGTGHGSSSKPNSSNHELIKACCSAHTHHERTTRKLTAQKRYSSYDKSAAGHQEWPVGPVLQTMLCYVRMMNEICAHKSVTTRNERSTLFMCWCEGTKQKWVCLLDLHRSSQFVLVILVFPFLIYL